MKKLVKFGTRNGTVKFLARKTRSTTARKVASKSPLKRDRKGRFLKRR